MKQFVKLTDANTIAYPPEITDSKKNAVLLWGEGNFVSHNIKKDVDPAIFSDKLKNGKIVIDDIRQNEADSVNISFKNERRDMAKKLRRGAAIREMKSKIDATKKYDKLTPLERKLAFGIGEEPTDEELGV